MTEAALALAEHILDRLASEGLLLPGDALKAVQKFADGELHAEDWRLLLEKGLQEKREEDAP